MLDRLPVHDEANGPALFSSGEAAEADEEDEADEADGSDQTVDPATYEPPPF